MAKGVLQLSQFGLKLDDSLKLSKSLLDFESSIGNELELELLTGKEFNLERARALAVTGKIADATEDVMRQMQGLTEEQRRSPLIMESMAKTVGLSADELNRAFIINKKLNAEAKDYYDVLIKQGKTKEANSFIDALAAGADREEMMKTMTVQDAFNAALEKAKDQFTGLVSSGVLDMLVDAIYSFAETMKDWGIGSDRKQQRVSDLAAQAEEKVAGQGGWTSGKDAAMLKQLKEEASFESSGFWAKLGQSFVGLRGVMAKEDEENEIKAEAATRKLQEINSGKSTIKDGKVLPVKDFVIKPLNEDTVTMAGGTKLGGNVEILLKELIAEVKAGRNIYLGTQKVNEALGLSLNALG
jgi:hypothetical protein